MYIDIVPNRNSPPAVLLRESFRKLSLHSLIARLASRHRDLVVAMIAARVVDARSKLATARALNPESAVSSLGHLLQLGTVDENELYAAIGLAARSPARHRAALGKAPSERQHAHVV